MNLPLFVLTTITNSAISPPIKWTKCARVITYKKDPETLLPGPVKKTPCCVSDSHPLNWKKENKIPNRKVAKTKKTDDFSFFSLTWAVMRIILLITMVTLLKKTNLAK